MPPALRQAGRVARMRRVACVHSKINTLAVPLIRAVSAREVVADDRLDDGLAGPMEELLEIGTGLVVPRFHRTRLLLEQIPGFKRLDARDAPDLVLGASARLEELV